MTLTHYGLREWGSAFVIMVLLFAGAWYLAFRMGCMRTGIAVAAVSVFKSISAQVLLNLAAIFPASFLYYIDGPYQNILN